MFKALAALLGVYVFLAVIKGEVFAKSGVWGKTVSRTASPEYFWVVIACYAGLALALATVF